MATLGRLSPDELSSATPVAAAPKPGTLGQLSPDELSTAAPAQWDQPQAPEPGIGEAALRGAEQGLTFGFGDEINAALEAATSDKSYVQARKESREAFAAAKEAHPIVFGASELAGGAAPMLLPGGAIAKTVGLGGKAVEAASFGRIGGEVARDVAAGAAMGGLSAAGNSEAGYKSDVGGFGQVAGDVVEGAALGGGLSAIGGALARRVTREAPQRATQDIVEAVTQNTPAKFAKKAAADATDIEATLLKPENKDVLANLGNTKKVIPLTEAKMDAIGSELDQLKTQLDDVTRTTVYKPAGVSAREPSLPSTSTDLVPTNALAKVEGRAASKSTIEMRPVQEGGGARLADIVEPIESKLSALSKQPGNGTEKRALREMLSDIKESWSPGEYDPDTIVSTSDLRRYTTQSQKLASNTIGTINESLASELKHDLSSTVTRIMNEHLDRAAAHSPEAAQIVAQMRALNTEYSAFANMLDAFRGTAWKEMAKRKGLSTIIGEGARNVGVTGAAVALATGNPLAAAGALAVPAALKGIDVGARVVNRWLSVLIRASAAGNPTAKVIQQAIEAGAPRAVAAHLAAKLAASKQ